MCAVSLVYDHYQEPFRKWTVPTPAQEPSIVITPPAITHADILALRELITEFREAVVAARREDIRTKQPDCEDPDKARLEQRVADLERRLNELGA